MTIYHQTMGQGDPLIVIHGLFGTSDNLKQVARSLSDTHTVYLIDAPCHGQSGSLDSVNLENMAHQVISFADKQGLTEFSILGHSLGGKIGMEIALRYPERVNKLIVADIAPVQYPRRHDNIISALESVPLNSLSGRSEADKILAKQIDDVGIRGFLLKSLMKVTDDQWQWKFDLQKLKHDYDNIIAPNLDATFTGDTLFIVGGASNYVKPEHQQEITKRFPNVKAKVIQSAGHWLHAEKPTAFIKICRDFLA